MTVPSTMADLSVSASGNSPDGSVDLPRTVDDNIRAVAAIVRRTQARGAAIASASTVNLGATTDGEFVHITGTTTISSFGTVSAGVERTLVFDGALTLTHSSNLLCPYLTSFTTTAGDVMTWRSEGSGVWKCVSHLPASSSSERDRLGLGTAATATVGTGSTEIPTNATVDGKIPAFSSSDENIAGTVENKAVDPLGIREAFNASGTAPVFACRAWVNFNGTGTVAIRASGNVSSITDNGTGDYTINFTTAMPDANYSVSCGGTRSDGIQSTILGIINTSAPSTTAVRVMNKDDNGSPIDALYGCVTVFR